MGMYNEVYYPCPACKKADGYMQVSQVVLGFGNFHLDDLSTLEELSEEELRRLKAYVVEGRFYCQDKECGHGFNPYVDERRRDLAARLFTPPTEEECS